jgi:pseudouridine kinase
MKVRHESEAAMTDEFSPTPEAPVLVIGAACVDIVGVLKGEMQTGTSNPAQIRTSCGGVGRNVAENLARLGQTVNLLTVVGEDQNGDHLIKTIAEAGVNVEAIKRTPLHPTGTYLGVVNTSGELQVALDDMRAMTLLSPDYLRQNEHLFRQAGLLFLDANLPKESLRTAMSLAKAAHLPVCADPTSSGLALKLKPYLKKLRMITPNSAEAAILTDQAFNTTRRREVLQAAKHLVSQGVDIVIVSMAAFGVCYATSETSGYIPAIQTKIVDPIGAGDAMTATVLFALLNDMPIDDAVRLGVSAASLTLRHRGTVVPDLSLEELYNELV